MRALATLLVILTLAASIRAGENEAGIRIETVRGILERARPHLEKLTGIEWPAKLRVELSDRAGLETVLLEEFEAQVRALHPEATGEARDRRARFLARAFAGSLRAKYGLATKRIHVAKRALRRLAPDVDPLDALTFIVLHEAVHAMDDRVEDLAGLSAAAGDPEALRALRMVLEGRAEHYGAAAAAALGVPPAVGAFFDSLRGPGERLSRTAGRKFIAALAARDPALPLRALRSPPVSTSVVFHPDRYPTFPEHPDPAKALAPLAGTDRTVEKLSELILRRQLLRSLSDKEVELAFAGFLDGAAATGPGIERVSLVAFLSDEQAARFLQCLRTFYGLEMGTGPTAGEKIGPGGRRYRFALDRRGCRVGEALSGAGGDPAATLRRLLHGEGGPDGD